VPIAAVVSDGQRSIRNAVATVARRAWVMSLTISMKRLNPFMKQTVIKELKKRVRGYD